jgi:hypothetical protein
MDCGARGANVGVEELPAREAIASRESNLYSPRVFAVSRLARRVSTMKKADDRLVRLELRMPSRISA